MSLDKFDPITGLLEGYSPEDYLAYIITENYSTCRQYSIDEYKELESFFPEEGNEYLLMPGGKPMRLVFQSLPNIITNLMYDHELIIKFLHNRLIEYTRFDYSHFKMQFSLLYQIPAEGLPLLLNLDNTSLDKKEKEEIQIILKWRCQNAKANDPHRTLTGT